ncbi:hypothetical protein [Geomonas oryzae]|uniref:hypothetical protein n=1 Tax=Geomonas oryzae TaxID=2364273 RepID=UPI00100B56E4|nr:hypothetical protein [Geomonas oryzae]
MARRAVTELYELDCGRDILGMSVAVEEELYRLVQSFGRPWERGWWTELLRRIHETHTETGGDLEVLVPFPLVRDLLVHCRVEHDSDGWYLHCEIARDRIMDGFLGAEK